MKKLLEKHKNLFIIFFLVLIPLIAILIASTATFLFYTNSVEQYDKTISFINLYNYNVHFELDDKSYSLQPFDIEVVKVYTRDAVIIDVKNENNDVVQKLEIKEISKTPHLNIEMLTDKYSQCFFTADVTQFYYSEGGEALNNPELKNITILKSEASLEGFKIFEFNTLNVYPGHSAKTDLPESLLLNEKVKGTYPISCDSLNNETKAKEVVTLYKNYNAEVQRQTFQQNIERINNLAL